MLKYDVIGVDEAARVVLDACGIPRRVSAAMRDVGNVRLPEFLKVAAQEAFMADLQPGGGPVADAIHLVRKGLKNLCNDGEFKFEE